MGLKACLVAPQNGGRDEKPLGNLVLSLFYHEDIGNATARQEVDKLPALNSLKPPIGVSLVFLEHIHITFAFSKLQTYPSPMQSKTTPVEDLCTDMLFATDEPPDEYHPMLFDLPPSILDLDGVQSPTCLTQTIGKQTSSPDSSFLREHQSAASLIDSVIWGSIEDKLPDTDSPSNEFGTVTTNNQVDFAEFIRLIDVGLRSMISKNETPLFKEIKTMVNSNGPKLAEIAPALFSPGYLKVSLTLSEVVSNKESKH